jgi:hypothetical protein
VRLAAPMSGSYAGAAASAPSCFGGLFLTPTRTVIMDRATRMVSLKRRSRRVLLRKIARQTRGAENEMKRMADDAPQLASLEHSAANLHQFIAFMGERHLARGLDPRAVAESTVGIRTAAKPGWELTFEVLSALMQTKENETFRACEEV